MLFLIKKTLGNFLVLPGLFTLVSLFLVLFLFKGRLRASKITALFLLFFLYFFSSGFGRYFVLKPLESAFPFPRLSKVNCSYIVVLGGGIVPRAPDEGGRAQVRGAPLERLLVAYKLWKLKGLPVVVSGGKTVYDETEASAMARVLETWGVPKGEIILEDKSRTTYENALYTEKLIGRERICLITSAYHIKRSYEIFRSFGFKVIPVPADYRLGGDKFNLYWFLPFPNYLKDAIDGFREYLGILFFKWRAREDSNLRPTD
ncbi:YdcF family protein [Thermovibrio sp.]